MILENIRDYVKIYENVLDKKYCSKVVKNLETLDWHTHSYYKYKTDNRITFKDDFDVTYANTKCGKEIQDKLWFVIEKYILKDIKYLEWFSCWSGYTQVRFNKYTKDTRMRIHCDHIHSMFDGKVKGIPTLSLLGTLNDDYEGGDFIMWETEKIEIPKGSVIVFPSNFMYPHQVNPVTKGARYSYVSWVY